MRPGDPRIRQTINQISHNLESANETAQEGIYAFSHNYIGPCFTGIRDCLSACTSPCFPNRDDQLRRRKRGRSSGRAEYIFDFYDDWDYDEDLSSDGILGWGNDELDRLLAGSSGGRGSSDQPRKNRRMSYGTRGGRRRKGSILPHDERQDPTVIPSSSFLGFLERFPWRIGARGIRYRPSAADLQVNPGGGHKRAVPENEPLLEASDESEGGSFTKQGRKRSGTESSRETSNSLSSRGDLISSDEEEDAIPLDDEFTMVLARRGTSFGPDDSSLPRRSTNSSLKETPPSRESKGSRARNGKGKGKRNKERRSTTASKSSHSTAEVEEIIETINVATIEDLDKEEENVQLEEEREVERRRTAAQNLALNIGLSINDDDTQNAQTPHILPNSDPKHDENEPPPSKHNIEPANNDAPVMRSESNDLDEARLKPPDDQHHET